MGCRWSEVQILSPRPGKSRTYGESRKSFFVAASARGDKPLAFKVGASVRRFPDVREGGSARQRQAAPLRFAGTNHMVALSPRAAFRSRYRLQPLNPRLHHPTVHRCPDIELLEQRMPWLRKTSIRNPAKRLRKNASRISRKPLPLHIKLPESAIAILADRVECRKQCREIRTTPQDPAVNFSHISVRILRYTARAIRLTIRVPPRP